MPDRHENHGAHGAAPRRAPASGANSQDQPAASAGSSRRTSPRLARGDAAVVIAATVGGFGGGILAVIYHLPPIVIAILLATGATSLVYGFLGGIQGASYGIGALKLTGTMAVLAGVTFALNTILVAQLPPLPITTADLIGEWKWVYGRGAWEGHLDFVKAKDGKLAVSGEEYHYKDQSSSEPIYRFSNGVATLAKDGQSLSLEFDVADLQWKRNFRLKTTQSMRLVPAFRGDLRPINSQDADSNDAWGIMIYRRPPGAQ